jgi:hypothetical protein
MSNLKGIKMVLPAGTKNRLACGSGTKFYLIDEAGTSTPIELSVSSFSVPETGADNILSVTITLPLLDVGYDIATTAEEIRKKLAELSK